MSIRDFDRDRRVMELTGQGLSAKNIAEMVGVTKRSVTRARARHAAVHYVPVTPLTADQLARGRAMLEDGASYLDVAKTLGCSNKTIHKRLPGYGWTRTQVGQYAALMQRHGKPLGL